LSGAFSYQLPHPSGNLNHGLGRSLLPPTLVTYYNAIKKLPLLDEMCNSLLEPESEILAKQLGALLVA